MGIRYHGICLNASPGDKYLFQTRSRDVATERRVAGIKSAAAESGLVASTTPTLLVEGDNKPGLAHKIAQTIADAGGDLSFFVAQAVGRRYSAVSGFANEEDAKKAATLIKKVAANKR